ncbi:EF-hand calcium-binding domain-containing protein 6 [Varanus komodoensis]|nr:EF-hand calcium-binding domain-containing protein 6 [Varanus komodoensis]
MAERRGAVFAAYDINAKGYLTHQEFLQKMGVENMAPDTGLNERIMAEDYAHFMDHYKREKKKHIDINEIIIKIKLGLTTVKRLSSQTKDTSHEKGMSLDVNVKECEKAGAIL